MFMSRDDLRTFLSLRNNVLQKINDRPYLMIQSTAECVKYVYIYYMNVKQVFLAAISSGNFKG